MNRFKKDQNAKYTSLRSEFYANAAYSKMAKDNPELWKSDRVRQEWLFCSVFTHSQDLARTIEQRELIWAVREKIGKIQGNMPLDGTEPSISFEEFAEWNVRYPID